MSAPRLTKEEMEEGLYLARDAAEHHNDSSLPERAMDQLREQHDELLAACELLLEEAQRGPPESDVEANRCLDALNAGRVAIAKARGK